MFRDITGLQILADQSLSVWVMHAMGVWALLDHGEAPENKNVFKVDSFVLSCAAYIN